MQDIYAVLRNDLIWMDLLRLAPCMSGSWCMCAWVAPKSSSNEKSTHLASCEFRHQSLGKITWFMYLIFLVTVSSCSCLPQWTWCYCGTVKISLHKIFLMHQVLWPLTGGLNMLNPRAFWITNLFDIDITCKCVLIC